MTACVHLDHDYYSNRPPLPSEGHCRRENGVAVLPPGTAGGLFFSPESARADCIVARSGIC